MAQLNSNNQKLEIKRPLNSDDQGGVNSEKMRL